MVSKISILCDSTFKIELIEPRLSHDHVVLCVPVCHLLSLWIGVSFHIAAAQQPVALSLVNVRPVTGLPPPACRWLRPPSLIAAMWNGAS